MVYTAAAETNFTTTSGTAGVVTVDLTAEALNNYAHDGWVHNGGTGDMYVAFSADGDTFGEDIRLFAGTAFNVSQFVNSRFNNNDVKIHSVRFTWIANTKYSYYFA